MDNDQLNRQLLELIEAEKAAFKKILDEFYSSDDQSSEKFTEVNDRLLNSLNRIFKLYEENDGSDSRFLTNTLKPLREARERAQKLKDMAEGRATAEEEFAGITVPDDREVVHISLYMVGGHDVTTWERQLESLGQLTQSRPIYRTEDDVQKAIRAKMSMSTEAYVSVAVKKSAIIDTGYAKRTDRQGCELVTLAEGAIDREDFILQFVLGGKYYRYVGGKLALVKSARQGSLFR